MMTTAEYVYTTWFQRLGPYARQYELDPLIVAGVICQESSGNQYAIRPEPAFFRRYLPGLKRLVASTVTQWDNYWMAYPELFSASYGLMQILFPVALERGYASKLRYPTELLDPALNIEIGCAHLYHRGGTTDTGLLRYNGGGDPDYPMKIRYWAKKIAEVQKTITPV